MKKKKKLRRNYQQTNNYPMKSNLLIISLFCFVLLLPSVVFPQAFMQSCNPDFRAGSYSSAVTTTNMDAYSDNQTNGISVEAVVFDGSTPGLTIMDYSGGATFPTMGYLALSTNAFDPAPRLVSPRTSIISVSGDTNRGRVVRLSLAPPPLGEGRGEVKIRGLKRIDIENQMVVNYKQKFTACNQLDMACNQLVTNDNQTDKV